MHFHFPGHDGLFFHTIERNKPAVMCEFSAERGRDLDTRTYISHLEEQQQNDSKGANPGFLRVSTVWSASARMEEREGGVTIFSLVSSLNWTNSLTGDERRQQKR